MGREWLQGLSLPPSLADSDVAIAHTLHKRGLKALQPSSYFNITLNLDTSQVRGFLFSARAALVWPRVVKLQPDAGSDSKKKRSPADEDESDDEEEEEQDDPSSSSSSGGGAESGSSPLLFEFPLTQVGNSSFRDLLLSNPSPQRPLLVHLVPLAAYPSGAKAATALPSSSSLAFSSANFTPSLPRDTFLVHSVVDSEDRSPLRAFPEATAAAAAAAGSSSSSSEESSNPDSLTKAFVLPPGRTARVRLRFRPPSGPGAVAADHRSALFVRNNLTGAEAVELGGRSVFGSLSFGGWRSGRNGGSGSSILRFEVQEKHLKDCSRKFISPLFINLTVKLPILVNYDIQ